MSEFCFGCNYPGEEHFEQCPRYVDVDALTASNAALRAELADWDKVLRQTAGEAGRGCTSPIGAVQNAIVELEQANESLRALVRELVDAFLQYSTFYGERESAELIARAKAALGDSQ